MPGNTGEAAAGNEIHGNEEHVRTTVRAASREEADDSAAESRMQEEGMSALGEKL